MSTSSIRTAGLAAALMGMAGGFGQSAAVIQRPHYDGPIPTPWRDTRSGNNRPAGLTFAAKKHRRKIARASRRYNLRTGA